MNLTTYPSQYIGQEVSLYAINTQVYINADELLRCASTSLEELLSTDYFAEKFDRFESMAIQILAKLNPNALPLLIAHPQFPKTTLVSPVAAYYILSQILAFDLNSWAQEECLTIRESLDNTGIG
jgi:hypothetical protein